ncbi:MAG: ferritin-like domain-containing protein [Spirochaetes bacterium]|nr:MAG: ferritin-like domain-containing protein [Spirochaetota bacterium]
MMDNLESLVRGSFRKEMLASGLYAVLAMQYAKKNPKLGARLREAAEQEHMHGRLFKHYYFNRFNKQAGNESFWKAVGRFIAGMMTVMPLKKKLNSLSGKESDAVRMIEAALAAGLEPSYQKILRRILPDEKSHAAIYKEEYSS